jgi:hypothetical protein
MAIFFFVDYYPSYARGYWNPCALRFYDGGNHARYR